MKKKIISLFLVGVLAVSSAALFSGCGDSDYPVAVANFEIKEKPSKVVVLDPNAADIISYIGYDVNMIGRSDEVNQEWLSIVPSFGSATQPDINAIVEGNTDVVFATEDMSKENKELIEEKGIKVITLSEAITQTQLHTNYITLGKILGGAESGTLKAESAYDELLAEMDKQKIMAEEARESDIPYEVCYLYSEDGQLKMMTSGTYGDMLLSYTGSVNVAVNETETMVEFSNLKVANPDYVFYDSEETLKIIKENDTLKSLKAVKDKKTLMVTSEEMHRQGNTALETLEKMIGFMYPSLAKQDVSSSDENGATESTQTEAKSLAEDYKINLKDLKLEYEQDNDNVLAMQKRLFDLGYIDDNENVTGYYGDVTKAAVKAFQKNSEIKETGTADNETLVAMFKEDAVSNKSDDDKKSESSESSKSE
ncbi:MAG: peptidoglycan-binding protein [Ruminococcus sp.]|nr:peptidoglycan-binding protein [Ruminococcus sp.]